MAVGDYNVKPFVSPVGSTEATQSRNNDNILRDKFVDHQSDVVAHIQSGTAASRPASGTAVGQTYVATDTGAVSVWNGTAWVTASGGGGVTDGDKGDITVSGSGTVWTIDNSVVTYAKIQNVSATDRVLGRSTAGAGVVEEIVCTAAGRALIDDADASAQRTTLGLGTLATASSVNLATQVTGVLGTANGGTNASTWPSASTGEYVATYDSTIGAQRLSYINNGTAGQALIVGAGGTSLTWGNPSPGSHVFATTTGLGSQHTTSGLTVGMILQATGATTARFQTPDIPASSVSGGTVAVPGPGTFGGILYTYTNDVSIVGTLTASNPISGSITGNAATVTNGVYTTGSYANPSWITSLAWSKLSGVPANITGLAGLAWPGGGPQFVKMVSSGGFALDSNTYITGNQTITLSGDVSGSGTTAITATLASTGVSAGNYGSASAIPTLTIDAKGRVTVAGTANVQANLGNVTGTLPIANGGTNQTAYAATGTGTRVLVYDQGLGKFDIAPPGTSGQFLQSSGTAGDVLWATPPNFSSSTAGYAPASGGGTTNFLRADGTWQSPPGATTISANNVTAGTFGGTSYTFTNDVTINGTLTANLSWQDELIEVVWGTPSKAGSVFTITGTSYNLLGTAISTAEVGIMVVVSDAANDTEPSATATINAAAGTTLLAGGGTATGVFKTNASGQFSITVTESATPVSRYIWIRAGGHFQRFVKARDGVLQLTY